MSVLERVADRLTGGTFTQLREAVTDLERELEDLGWYSLSGAGSDTEFKLDDRRKLLKKCYLYWRKAPLAGAVTRMMADFTFGQGLATPKVEDPKAQEFISGIWDDPDNQRILFGHQAQQLVNNKLWYEGELFIVHFFAKDASVRLRLLNASEIEDIITDPEDRNTPLYYKRMPRRRRYDFPSHTWAPTDLTAQPEYHADIGLADWLEDPENKKRARKAGLVDQATKPGEVMHVKVNCDVNDLRGIPPLYRSVDWVKAHRTMAGDLATFIKALSIWAWKKKVKGGSGIVSAAKARFHTDLDNLTNPPPATGSVHVENLASDLQPINTPTGGATLHSQGLRAMVLQVAAASGIMEHYFGDPSCYDADTEALTRTGWKRYDEWKGERVACFNPETNLIEYHLPIDLRVFDYHGDMVHFKSSRQDILVTPNHRMWTAASAHWRDPDWHIVEAREMLNGERWRVRNACSLTEQPESVEHSDAWLRFVAHFVGEGHTLADRPRVSISQKPGRVLDQMRQDFATCFGKPAWESTLPNGVVTLMLNDEPKWEWLRQHCGTCSEEYEIPEWVFSCSLRQQRIVLDTLMAGDGGHTGREHGTCLRYSTRSRVLADQVQRLCLHQGWQASVHAEEGRYRGAPYIMYRVNVARERDYTDFYPDRIHRVSYDGIVWCFQVPYGLYVTRRNGKVAIQGNTGNLATATSMELPMVKLFMSNQQLWRDIYLRILREALRRGGFDRGGKLPEIEIEFPPILSREVATYVHAVVEAGMMGYLDGPVASELIMRALGVKDIEKELKKMIGEGETKPLTESDRRRAADLIFLLRKAREEIKRDYASSHADAAS